MAVLLRLGRVDEAEHRAILEIRRRVLGEDHSVMLVSRGSLAGVMRELGRLEEAQALQG